MRVLFFGMSGVFSIAPLEALLANGVDLRAVVVPGANAAPRRWVPPPPGPSDLPLLNPQVESNILHLAWAHEVPVWAVGPLKSPEALAWLAQFQPDLIVVACFSRILPPAWLALPTYGCLNLHPSPLPAYRGPAPLFWQARQGEPQTGVTLHFLDEGIDSGDIVAQAAFEWPEGIAEVALEQRCARAGAALLSQAVQRLRRGEALPRRLQSETEASYFSWPGEDDFRVPTTWSARRAFNFLRFGLADWPLWLDSEGQQLFVQRVIAYNPHQALPQPLVELADGELWVQFAEGVLRVWPAFRPHGQYQHTRS